MAKIERKQFASYLDGHTTGTDPAWYLLGIDLEDYSVDMNAEFESKANILGTSSTQLKGYDPQSSVSPYYADKDDDIFEKLQAIIDNRATGDAAKTKSLEVQLWNAVSGSENTYVAYQEDATIVIQSYGGDTGGYQIAFDVKYNGNRVKGKFNTSTKTFTAD